jgi:prefoldin subunit 5
MAAETSDAIVRVQKAYAAVKNAENYIEDCKAALKAAKEAHTKADGNLRQAITELEQPPLPFEASTKRSKEHRP